MTTTFGQLTDQIHSLLHSATGIQEQMTWLTAGCTASETTLSVMDSDSVSQGISEIEDELVYVSASEGNVLTLAPFGRGFRGSDPVTHATNAPVTFNPYFPRVEIKRAINECLAQVYPQLYRIEETTFTFNGHQLTYELPADCGSVVKVLWQLVGPSKYWETSYGWRFEDQSSESSGKAITLLDMPQVGQTVKVVYQAKFGALSGNSDTLEDSGFPLSAVDLIGYSVAAKLIRFLDLARMQIGSVENASRSQLVQVQDAGKIANQMYAMYQQRLAEERKRLLDLNPPSMYFTR